LCLYNYDKSVLISPCAENLDIHFNDKKSNLIKFGHDYKDNIDNLKLNGCDVTWVSRVKYLGIRTEMGKLINIDVLMFRLPLQCYYLLHQTGK